MIHGFEECTGSTVPGGVSLRSMRHLVVAGSVFLVLAAGTPAATQETPTVRVRIDTAYGAIDVEIDTARAPRTSANFLRYVDDGYYDGGQFHRTVTMDNQPDNDVRIEVIQASIDASRREAQYPPIALERTTVSGLRHIDGAISMARSGPDTATSSFFICVGDQPSLDFGGDRNPDGQGFAAFGRVVAGMEIVRTIQHQPAEGQQLTPRVRIDRVSRLP